MSKEIDFRKMMSRAPRVRLGDYIETIDSRNSLNEELPFYGVNKDKQFMPSVANTDTVDRKKYKVIKSGQFVFSGMQTGRDICIRISLFKEDKPALLSPAYTIFKIADGKELIPEFLFIQFLTTEKDRFGWFLSDSSVRANLDWDRFCDIEIPLPSIEVQREIVATYEGLKKIAEENEALLEPLQAACHAYIVDCKAKYPAIPLEQLIDEYNDLNIDNSIKTVKSVSVYKEFRDTNAKVNKDELSRYKIVLPGQLSYVQTTKNEKCFACAVNNSDQPIVVTSVNKVIGSKNERILSIEYLFLFFNRPEFDRYAIFNSWGSAREVFQYDDLKQVMIPLPPIEVQKAIVSIYHCMEEAKSIAREARELMKTICPALIQKAANSI